MVDEMDLLNGLKAAEPVRPHAFEEARAVLRAAMAVEGVPETKTPPRRRSRWGMRRTVGLSAAALAAAAAAAAVLVATSASTPGKPPAKAAANPILAKLAADISPLRAKAPGDATLEIRNQSPTSDALGGNGIGLFTDDGTYYWGNDKSALRRAIVAKSGGDDVFKRDIAAALSAVKGDVDTARARMAVANIAPGTHPDPERAREEKLKALAKARGKKYVPPKPRTPEQQKEITDNHIWANAIDALIAAPENPQVRAGCAPHHGDDAEGQGHEDHHGRTAHAHAGGRLARCREVRGKAGHQRRHRPSRRPVQQRLGRASQHDLLPHLPGDACRRRSGQVLTRSP